MRAAAFLIVAAVFLVLLYRGGRWLEHRMEKPEARGDYTQRYAYDGMMEQNDVTYRRRKDVTTILLMGIDTEAEASAAQEYRDGGQADFLRLLVLDNANESITQIQIDRDTMTPITVLGVLGDKSGVRTAQISLAHGFGDGRDQSCELTADAVSNLFFGIPIDFYVAMNLDGIAVLNDRMGGVTVTLEDDFSALDPSMTPGATLTLTGDQAEIFVRSRKDIENSTNEARMTRQELYISQLEEQLYERMSEDEEFANVLYDELSPYLTTNLSRGRLINEAWAAMDYRQNAIVKPEGVHEVGKDGFMRFYVDEAALQQTVMELFYEEVK